MSDSKGVQLILAEKPSQAQAYANAFKNVKKEKGYYTIPKCETFPNGAYLTYGVGHLVSLKNPHEYKGMESLKKWSLETLPIIPKTFEYKVTEATKDQFQIVKQLVNKVKNNDGEIIIGSDIDREGELLSRLSINQAGGESLIKKRLWINSLEEEEVRKGFDNLRDSEETINLYHEAQARQISDWIVGISGTRLYSILLQKKGIKTEGAMSVGRVQSPSLFLIYKRQKEIETFVPKPFHELIGTFKTDKGNYKGKFKERFDNKDQLTKMLSDHNLSLTGKHEGVIASVDKKSKKENAPSLHSLSSLQTLANKKYKISPSETLKIVQKLYDSPLKLVSYPRTDTKYITENEYRYLFDKLTDYQNLRNVSFETKQTEPNSRYVSNEQVKEHYAIIPTRTIPTKQTLDQLSDKEKHIYYEILSSVLYMFHEPYKYEETIITTSVNDIPFESKGKVETSKGWKAIAYQLQEKKENVDILPDVIEKDIVQTELNIKDGKTSPPKSYTEGDLINMMKTCGKHDDIDEADQNILKEVEGLGTEATRSGIIEVLKNQSYIAINKNKVLVTKKGELLCRVIEGTMLSKPEMTAKWESYLKKIGQGEGSKKIFIQKASELIQEIINTQKEVISNDQTVHQLAGEMSQVQGIAKCPQCTKAIIDRKTFYGCDGYRDGCKQSFPKEFRGKKVTNANVKQLCEKGKTNKIKGYKKKDSDKTYDGYLLLEGGQVKFSFN